MDLKTKRPVRLQNNLNNIQELCHITSNESANSDLLRMFLGKKLGEGAFRSVYEFNPNPEKYVVKIEVESSESNANEFLIWEEVSGLCGEKEWVKDWFAPVLWMSPNSRILIQERSHAVPRDKRGKILMMSYPDMVPDFFMDVKGDNFGWIGDRPVCHDYGFINRFIQYNKKFKKANW